ncbi:hypothetical protein [Streptomyces sp. IMTB 2501]|uniref:hypothetical protein n=1 Tax=Streptomyces sp. IMTB 2501 TaxID=1776340 RepID=UPI0015BEE56B|nr:hypothetical protein [Streptomyces sp. IMTB 2501]
MRELSGTGEERRLRALRVIGIAFAGLALYSLVQSTLVLATTLGTRRWGSPGPPSPSP